MNGPDKFPSPEKSEKQLRWDEIAARVERTVDKLKKPVDAGIKEGVIALNALDINTTGSCEGHENWGVRAPYIDVEAEEVEELTRQAKELKGRGADEERLKAIAEEIEKKNLEERKKLFLYLEEFYSGRNVPFHQRLVVQGLARGWSRLQSQGVDMQKIEPDEVKKQRLLEYQKEMQELISFLKDRYFGEEK